MSNSIFISDDYIWTASFGLFELVLELLEKRTGDQETRDELRNARENYLSVDVWQLPPTGREDVLRAIREHIVEDVEASPQLTSHELTRRSTLGHVKVLRLMANDLPRAPELDSTPEG